MKRIALIVAMLSLGGCSLFMANYDSNEYGLVNKVRTIAQFRSCDAESVKQLHFTALELKNFSELLPSNDKTADMDSKLYTMVEELYKKPQPIGQVYCDLKLKTIETTAETIQTVAGKRPR